MRIRSSLTQSILLFISLLLASQVFSYYAVFNYALMPSLATVQQNSRSRTESGSR